MAEIRVTGVSEIENATGAEASAGMCNAWQMWQGVSGPLVCSCRNAPPQAKYSRAAQARSAKPRRSQHPSCVKCVSILQSLASKDLHLSVPA